jgi:hypothetical protein
MGHEKMEEELDDPAVSALSVRSRKLSNIRKGSHRMGDKIYCLERLRASGGMGPGCICSR